MILGFKVGCVSEARYKQYSEIKRMLEESLAALKSVTKKAKDWGITTKNPNLKRYVYLHL